MCLRSDERRMARYVAPGRSLTLGLLARGLAPVDVDLKFGGVFWALVEGTPFGGRFYDSFAFQRFWTKLNFQADDFASM